MGWWARLNRTFRGGAESDLEEELRFHVDMDMAEGRSEQEARRRLGNLTRITEETRSTGILEWLDSVLQDIRYAFRQLRATPLLVLAIVVSTGIGIGANTAIFTLIDAALLRPLPVANPESLRIVEWIHGSFPKGVENINGDFVKRPEGGFRSSSISSRLYRELAQNQTSFEVLMGVADGNTVAVATDSSPAEQVQLQYVSSNFFQGVGASPVIGRAFLPEEDRPGAEPTVIVSHRFWLNHLAAQADAIHRSVRINNVPARIAGVAPPGFFGLRAGQWTDLYAPLAARMAFSPAPAGRAPRGENDRDWWVRQFARLKPGMHEASSIASLAGHFRKLAAEDGMEASEIPQLVTLPGQRGFNTLNARDGRALLILFLLVGVLLLIVCANVANLLLSRSISRQRESAVRLALGAARGRLFRQHLTESLVLALFGGLAGIGLGYMFAQSIHTLFQTGRDVSNVFDLTPDRRVLGYTAALCIVTSLLFGLAPAMRAARSDLNDALKNQARSLMGGNIRLPRLLAVVQIALCLIALVSAGLLGRSLTKLQWTDIGYERENLAYASVNPSQAGYSAGRVHQYLERVREELERIPGVTSVSTTEVRLLSGNGNVARASLPGRPMQVRRGEIDMEYAVSLNKVGSGFFETMGIPLIEGRSIQRQDLRPDADAIVVDERFAARFFPGQSAIGRRFGLTLENNAQYEIVGVVQNTPYNSLRDTPLPALYQPYHSGAQKGPVHFVIRAGIPSDRLAESARRAIAAADAGVPVTEFHTQNSLIDRLLRTERLLGFVSAAFGAIALTIAAIGIGGVLAYTVARRRSEIGLRVALGASRGEISRMVLRDCFRMLALGTLIGLPGAWAAGQFLRTTLFHMQPMDPLTTGLSFIALLSIAGLAAWIPARRAASIDPMTALREE